MRPDWTQYFLGLAYITSLRSFDETKHGCIIVKNKIPIGFGYNGLASGLNNLLFNWVTGNSDKKIIIHAEVNAIINSSVNLKFEQDLEAYITGKPCPNCLSMLIANNIKRIYFPPGKSYNKYLEDVSLFDRIVSDSGVDIIEVDRNLSWIYHNN